MSSATSQEEGRTAQEQVVEGGASPKIDALSFAGAAAVVSGLVMVALGILGAAGVYEQGVGMMQAWHVFFRPTLLGTIAGAVEAIVSVFALTYITILLYNVSLEYRG
jgi:hypothetical protein